MNAAQFCFPTVTAALVFMIRCEFGGFIVARFDKRVRVIGRGVRGEIVQEWLRELEGQEINPPVLVAQVAG